MHLEDRLAIVRGCLEEGGSILFRSITSNRNPADSSLLKTCFYHMKSLNETIQHDPHSLLRKENQHVPLPDINHTRKTKNNKEASSFSLLPRTQMLLNRLADRAVIRPEASASSLLKLSSSILLRQTPNPPDNHKQCQIKVRKRPHFKNLYSKPCPLNKEQRFFENQAVKPSPQLIQTLGCYEAGNLYKTKNLQGILNEMKVVACKPQFNPIKLANKHDLFLTNISAQAVDFCVQEFIEQELNKEKDCQKVIKQCDSVRMSRDISKDDTFTSESHPPPLQHTDLYLSIRDYAFIKDQSFRLFRARHIDQWGDVLLTFDGVLHCLKQQKISCLKIKGEKLLLWSGKKVTQTDIIRVLGLQPLNNSLQRIKNVCFGFIDRLRVRRVRIGMARQESLARWVSTRFKTFTLLRRVRREKQAKALRLHRQLAQELQWDTEIHLPSFSVDEFQRNTTQYLQSFENIYHAMWKNSTKHLVLVLPTLNQNIIKALQARLRVTRPLTIICPEVHETFPNNLSLAAQVLFSYESLKRIERAIDGRVAVLVPGCDRSHSKMEHQMLLSEYLNVPLLCSLEMRNDRQQQKAFFVGTGFKSQPHCIIPPGTSPSDLLAAFSQLLLAFPEERKWLLKLEGQFKGRGIASIKLNPSRYMKRDGDQQQNLRLLLQHLKSSFKLKLKINFQNSLYMVQDFLKQLQARGGVIEEELEVAATYEVCFIKHAVSEMQYLYRLYGTDYSNKIWLSQEATPDLQPLLSAMQDHLEQGNYLGHINATFCKTNNGHYYGIDLKLHQTYSSSVVSFIHLLEEKRAFSHEEATNISHLPTKRVPNPTSPSAHSASVASLDIPLQNYSYLVIPNLVFTDVEEEVKARIIEELVGECWGDRHVRLQDECRVFLSMGVDFAMVLAGRDVRRLKKRAIDTIRELNDRTSSHRQYRGKEVIRDVFQYGDIIRALTQIKQ